MAEAGAWPGIQCNGLRSTTALLDAFEYCGAERSAIESRRRPQSVTINTGATLYPTASARGSDTFKSIANYPLEEYVRWRGQADAIVELAVDYEVPRVEEIAIVVERRFRDEPPETLWER